MDVRTIFITILPDTMVIFVSSTPYQRSLLSLVLFSFEHSVEVEINLGGEKSQVQKQSTVHQTYPKMALGNKVLVTIAIFDVFLIALMPGKMMTKITLVSIN